MAEHVRDREEREREREREGGGGQPNIQKFSLRSGEAGNKDVETLLMLPQTCLSMWSINRFMVITEQGKLLILGDPKLLTFGNFFNVTLVITLVSVYNMFLL